MPKKTLATILKESTDTIEYRAIRKQLMIKAQNKSCEIGVWKEIINNN